MFVLAFFTCWRCFLATSGEFECVFIVFNAHILLTHPTCIMILSTSFIPKRLNCNISTFTEYSLLLFKKHNNLIVDRI